MTPGGSPASSSTLSRYQSERTAVEAGFQTTALPISAGAVGRLAAMAVKLNGVSAKTNPSSGRYSIRFQIPGEETGWSAQQLRDEVRVPAPEVDHLAGGVDLGLLDGLRLAEHGGGVERGRHGPASRSAALSSTAARSCQAIAAQLAPRLARRLGGGATSAGPAWWKRASTWWCRCGARTSAMRPVRTSWPPMTSGISMGVAAIRQAGLQRGPLGRARGVGEGGLVLRGGDAEAALDMGLAWRRRITPNRGKGIGGVA